MAEQHQREPLFPTIPSTADTWKMRPRPKPMPKSDRHDVRTSLLAGSGAGIVSTFIMYPMELLRVKMQTDVSRRSPFQTLRHTIHHGGVRALYTGLSLPLCAQSCYKATVFSVNNMTQNALLDYRLASSSQQGEAQRPNQVLSLSDQFLCGAVGGMVNAAIFVTPVEFVRNQLIAQHSKLANSSHPAGNNSKKLFNGVYDVVRYAAQQRPTGVLSLWRGVSLTMTRDAIGCGCFFYTMGFVQKQLTPEGAKPTFLVTVTSGGMAGLAFWVAALPMDTAKTLIQSSDINSRTTVRETVRNIFASKGLSRGMQRFFRGWQIAYSRGAPSAAITISVYSLLSKQLEPLFAIPE